MYDLVKKCEDVGRHHCQKVWCATKNQLSKHLSHAGLGYISLQDLCVPVPDQSIGATKANESCALTKYGDGSLLIVGTKGPFCLEKVPPMPWAVKDGDGAKMRLDTRPAALSSQKLGS